MTRSPRVSDQREPKWFWADVADVPHWKRLNPTGLRGRELGEWANRTFEEKLDVHLAEVAVATVFGSPMAASEENGELKFFVGNRCIVSGVFVSSLDAPLILAQWRQKARDTFASDTMNARKIVSMLLDLKSTENVALIEQLADLNKRLDGVEQKIRGLERELDDRLFELYGLSDDERLMVEADTTPRWHARMPATPTA